jgi:molybdenum cofactor synthesis domain-containing protein
MVGKFARKRGSAMLISMASTGTLHDANGAWDDFRHGGCRGPVFGYFGRTGARRRGEVMSEIITAGILVIGDEILSGRTKDKNIGFIAEYLTNIGIDLKEVRVVADEEPEIIAALDALRHRYTYVFTTGGIGPTHDDITADSIAKAFGVGIDHHPEVVARFKERFQNPGELNEARLRMARIPDGAELIQSATILAPGFKIGNVIVMAGVPSIMQAMMDIVSPKLKSGVRMLSDTVRANAREGDIGGPLRAIANAHPDTIIGSYPFQDEEKKPNTNLVVRSRDLEKLNAAMTAVKEMLAGLNTAR